MHVSSEYKLSALLKGGAETAHRLLEAVTPLRAAVAPDRLRARWDDLLERPRIRSLLDPHSSLSATSATRIAIATAVASVIMTCAAWVHFDGALDVHARPQLPGTFSLCFDLAISWLLTATFLWIASLMADTAFETADGAKPSFREFVVAVGVARVPTLIIALLTAALPRPETAADSVVRGLLLAPFFAWFIVLLYMGFAYVSGVRGKAAAIPFLAGLVTAEAISKAFTGSL
jgi:hypothetical protein